MTWRPAAVLLQPPFSCILIVLFAATGILQAKVGVRCPFFARLEYGTGLSDL